MVQYPTLSNRLCTWISFVFISATVFLPSWLLGSPRQGRKISRSLFLSTQYSCSRDKETHGRKRNPKLSVSTRYSLSFSVRIHAVLAARITAGIRPVDSSSRSAPDRHVHNGASICLIISTTSTLESLLRRALQVSTVVALLVVDPAHDHTVPQSNVEFDHTGFHGRIGPGIAEEIYEIRLLQRAAPTTEINGPMLGLWLVCWLVGWLGGRRPANDR